MLNFNSGEPNGEGNGNGEGKGNGGPCCATCYCFPFHDTVLQVQLEDFVNAAGYTDSGRSELFGKMAFDYAEQWKHVGQTETAYRFYEAAGTLYSDAIQLEFGSERGLDYSLSFLQGLGYSWDELQNKHSPNQLLATLSPVFAPDLVAPPVSWPTEGVQSDRLSRLFHDYLTSISRASMQIPEGPSSSTEERILEAAAWGSQVSAASPYRSLHYDAMGTALFNLKMYPEASRAFAAAWQNGLQSTSVLESYQFAISLAQTHPSGVGEHLEPSIAEAQVLDGHSLRAILMDVEENLR